MTQGAPIFTFTSKRSGKRGWKAAGLNLGSPGGGNPGGNPAGRLTAYAYCQKKKAGSKVLVRSKTVRAPALNIRNLDVKCPHRRKALSGGFDGHYGISSGGLTGRGGDHLQARCPGTVLAHRRPRSFQSGPGEDHGIRVLRSLNDAAVAASSGCGLKPQGRRARR